MKFSLVVLAFLALAGVALASFDKTEPCVCAHCDEAGEAGIDPFYCAEKCESYCEDEICEACQHGKMLDFNDCYSGCEPELIVPSGRATSSQFRLLSYKTAVAYRFANEELPVADKFIKILGLEVHQAYYKGKTALNTDVDLSDYSLPNFKITMGPAAYPYILPETQWGSLFADTPFAPVTVVHNREITPANLIGVNNGLKTPKWVTFAEFQTPYIHSEQFHSAGLMLTISHDAATPSGAPEIFLAAKSVLGQAAWYNADSGSVPGEAEEPDQILHQQIQFRFIYEIIDDDVAAVFDGKK